MDLWDSYDSSATSQGFSIADLHGREFTTNEVNSIAIWRKPFVRITHREGSDIEGDFAREQLRVYLRSITSILRKNGSLRLVDPFLEMSLSKLLQLQIAESFFDVPPWQFRTLSVPQTRDKLIVKPIGYPMLNDGRTVFTNLVNPVDLSMPYPWLFQEPILGGEDVTCVFIAGNLHWFKSRFKRSETSIDWRTEIQTDSESEWVSFEDPSTALLEKPVKDFMEKVGLKYGRLDFIQDESGRIWFLECNVNGEFGWLDNSQQDLHREFFEALLLTVNRIQ